MKARENRRQLVTAGTAGYSEEKRSKAIGERKRGKAGDGQGKRGKQETAIERGGRQETAKGKRGSEKERKKTAVTARRRQLEREQRS